MIATAKHCRGIDAAPYYKRADAVRYTRQTIESFEHSVAPCDSHVMHPVSVHSADPKTVYSLFLPRYLYVPHHSHLHEVTWSLVGDRWWGQCGCGHGQFSVLDDSALRRTRHIAWYACERCYGASTKQLESMAAEQGITRRLFLQLGLGAGLGWEAWLRGFGPGGWGLKPYPAEAAGATFYVSNVAANGYVVGNNSNSGTSPSNPWLTIKHGMQTMASGDILIVNGISATPYVEDLVGVAKSGPSSSTYTIVRAADNATVVVKPTINWCFHFQNGIQFVEIRDIVCDGANLNHPTGFDCVKITIGSTAARNIRLTRLTYRNASGSGILIGSNAGITGVEVIGGRSHSNGREPTIPENHHGIYCNLSSNTLIQDIELEANSWNGLQVFASVGGIVDPTARRIRAFENGINDASTGNKGGSGILLQAGSGHLAYNCVTYRNRGKSITSGGGISNGRVFNVTCHDGGASTLGGTGSSGKGGYLHTSGTCQLRNAAILGNLGSPQIEVTGGTLTQGTNVTSGTASNIWVDPVNRDYHLKINSPSPILNGAEDLSSAMNSGPYPEPTPTDYDSVVRPKQTGWDIGAYEFSPPTPETDPIASQAPNTFRATVADSPAVVDAPAVVDRPAP